MTWHPEPVTEFDYDRVDGIEDSERPGECCARTARQILEELLKRSNIKLAVASLGYAVGLFEETTGTAFALKIGVSKQAFNSAAEQWRKSLNLRKNHVERSREGCAAMRTAFRLDNIRRRKQ